MLLSPLSILACGVTAATRSGGEGRESKGSENRRWEGRKEGWWKGREDRGERENRWVDEWRQGSESTGSGMKKECGWVEGRKWEGDKEE